MEGIFHYNWLLNVVDKKIVYIATGVLASSILVVMGLLARRSLALATKESYSPAGKFSLRGIFESLTEVMISLNDMVLGPENRKFAPVFATIFTYILFNNLLGMIPGMFPATENINKTVAMGLFSFLCYNFYGLKFGGLHYLKHFLGPVLWLAWLMLPLELVSHLVRPMSLGLRLMGTISGDHTVLAIFLDLAPWGVPIIFYAFGLFVSFIQALVFTLLSMVYVSMAIADDH